MKKQLTFISTLFMAMLVYSQVGINTAKPNATLDVTGKPSDTSILDGVIVPRITGDQLALKIYTADQIGAVIYATSPAGTLTDQVINVNSEGLYYFNGTVWVSGKGSPGPQGPPGMGSEVDGVIGNEVLNATTNRGLVRGGSGTAGNPYTLGLIEGSANGQVMKWNGTSWNPSLSDNIYNTNGTLTDERTLSQAGKTLSFVNTQKTTFINNAAIGFVQDSGSTTRSSIGLSNNGINTLWLYSDTNSAAQIIATNTSNTLSIGTSSTTNSAPISFTTSPGSNALGQERAEISGDGRFNIVTRLSVGYGGQQTFTGSQRLKINGSIVTTGATYPDYVFQKYFTGTSKINPEYNFTKLEDIKKFVKDNHHLPGVISIKELQKSEEGYNFDITELSIQQLEKIEELYLHAFEQNDLVKKQQTEINDLRSRVEQLERLIIKQ